MRVERFVNETVGVHFICVVELFNVALEALELESRVVLEVLSFV